MKPQKITDEQRERMYDLAEKSDLPDDVESVDDLLNYLDEEDDSNYEVSEAQLKSWFEELPVALLDDMEDKAMSPDPRAARLRRYWSVGEGGTAKIRWGQPGDGKRCIRHLSKYLGTRAAGYCQNLHRVNVAGTVMGHGPGEKEDEFYWESMEFKKKFSEERRRELADEGEALPDGSFPIENEQDLRNAIQAFGRAKDKERAKRHIIKRARALGLERLIPEGWTGEKEEPITLELKVIQDSLDDLLFDVETKEEPTEQSEPVTSITQRIKRLHTPEVIEEKEEEPVTLEMKVIQEALEGFETN